MSQPTYTAEVVVLRKTKLGESDLILTCLDSEGAQARFVAKGARKPSSSFSSRLELFSHAEVFAARGKTLDIVKEARLLQGHETLRTSFERTAAASVLCEFIYKATEEALATPRLYLMALAALDAMETCEISSLEAIAAACVLKGFAMIGLRPELRACVECGRDLSAELQGGGTLWFSYQDGGAVCPHCNRSSDCVAMSAQLLGWIYTLLYGTFDEIAKMDTAAVSFPILQMCQQWSRVHVGYPVKAIDYLLTNPVM